MGQRAIIDNGDGTVSILVPAKNTKLTMQEIVNKDAPGAEIVDESEIPSDRTFRDQWTKTVLNYPGLKVGVDIAKAATALHIKRREKRDAEMAPYDDAIAKQIPGSNPQDLEVERQKIRVANALVQAEIDSATIPDELKAIYIRENY